jgi:hypothetical protein
MPMIYLWYWLYEAVNRHSLPLAVEWDTLASHEYQYTNPTMEQFYATNSPACYAIVSKGQQKHVHL